MNMLGSHTWKSFIMNVLNGSALGIVSVLIPGAILSVPLKALLPIWPEAQAFLNALALSNSAMGIAVGMIIGHLFKLAPIQIISVGLASFFTCGVAKVAPDGKTLMLAGTGDVITMMITSAIAVLLILAIQDRVKSVTLLVIPAATILIAGGVGYALYPYISEMIRFVGNVVAYCVKLQPLAMCILISVIFSIIIMTPITTVGIALSISLSGLGSGAANLGVCAAGFTFFVAGWKVNSFGTCLAHCIGSPKISMPIILSNPKIMLPVLCNAVLMGIVVAIFGLEGTSFSAGFGFSGFVGPIAALDLSAAGWSAFNVILIFSLFSLVPGILGYVFTYIFCDILHLIKPEDYKLKIS